MRTSDRPGKIECDSVRVSIYRPDDRVDSRSSDRQDRAESRSSGSQVAETAVSLTEEYRVDRGDNRAATSGKQRQRESNRSNTSVDRSQKLQGQEHAIRIFLQPYRSWKPSRSNDNNGYIQTDRKKQRERPSIERGNSQPQMDKQRDAADLRKELRSTSRQVQEPRTKRVSTPAPNRAERGSASSGSSRKQQRLD
ncbi:hypothetical protein FQR65_LT14735 [Abscondita terminalis]|nr:hypothetical protein FQR65_LT14735 [Abscondita terminalis]